MPGDELMFIVPIIMAALLLMFSSPIPLFTLQGSNPLPSSIMLSLIIFSETLKAVITLVARACLLTLFSCYCIIKEINHLLSTLLLFFKGSFMNKLQPCPGPESMTRSPENSRVLLFIFSRPIPILTFERSKPTPLSVIRSTI